MSAADKLLSRLDSVRRSSKGWTARCPAHPDRTASLSIAEGDEGRTLVHCFAGCAAADVVAAVGLELADLFPERIRDTSPMARHQRREYAQAAQARAAISALAQEATIVLIAAGDVLADKPLDWMDYCRLVQAEQRIVDARAVLQ